MTLHLLHRLRLWWWHRTLRADLKYAKTLLRWKQIQFWSKR